MEISQLHVCVCGVVVEISIELFDDSFGFDFFILVCCPYHSFLLAATEGGLEASATHMKDISSPESVDTSKNRKLVSIIVLLY